MLKDEEIGVLWHKGHLTEREDELIHKVVEGRVSHHRFTNPQIEPAQALNLALGDFGIDPAIWTDD